MTPQRPTLRLRDPQVIEARLAARLAASLSEQAQALPHDLSERLRVAREQAVARARSARAQAPAAQSAGGGVLVAPAATGPAWAGGFGAAPFGGPVPWWQRAASVLPLVMLVLGFMMVDHFSTQEQVAAAAEIDALLLADDLPPDAYSDPGFGEYLRNTPP